MVNIQKYMDILKNTLVNYTIYKFNKGVNVIRELFKIIT